MRSLTAFYTMMIRTLLLGLAALIITLPATAQSTCSDCVGSGSDIAGALFQSEAPAWRTAEAQAQLNARAVELNTLSTTNGALADAFATAPVARALLSTEAYSPEMRESVQADWVAQGMPQAAASDLLDAVTGLTAENTVNTERLQESLTAYNAAVEAAGDTFVTATPDSFIAIRHALHELIRDVE